MKNTITILSILAMTLFSVNCSHNYGYTFSGTEQNFTVALEGDPSIDGDVPVVTGDDVSVDNPFEGDDPVPPDTADEDMDPNDDDGDGIENDEDDIPDVCTAMVVTAKGVSSAVITLNDEEVFSPSDFKNVDAKISRNVNLKAENTLSILIAGSKGDQLNVRIYNCSKSPSELLFETTVTRTTGTPNTGGGEF